MGSRTRFRDEEVEVTTVGVLLIPRQAWWTAFFWPHINTPVYCDVTTIPEWGDGVVTMVDLDLDVIRRHDGTVVLDDEDEFEDHQVKYAYPVDVIKAAEAAAEELLCAVRNNEGAFNGAHERWLAQVR